MKKRSVRTGDVVGTPSNAKAINQRKDYLGFMGPRSSAVSKSQGYYNPALIKRQKEYFKNASYVSKFRKNLRHQTPESITTPIKDCTKADDKEEVKRKKLTKKAPYGLSQVFKKHKENNDKERIEKEASMAARKQLKESAIERRKAEREKMMKKTKRGQPLMRFRIEHLLQTIEDSSTL